MGHAFQSQLRRWDVIAELCASINAETYVEVGCKEGRTTGFVLDKLPNIRAVAIDPWLPQEGSSDPTRETYKDWDFSAIEAEFWKNIGRDTTRDYSDRCHMMRLTSEVAASRFNFVGRLVEVELTENDTPGDFLDLPATLEWDAVDVVFIDALHDYESVRDDIARWWPLVKPGGILVMHDYNHKWPGVMRAVADSFNLFDVNVAPDSVAYVQKRRPQ